jgi:CubicO group peptidase (beta-lactamase class C family)
MDWAGKVLEAITGQTLGQYSKENIFDKVGCKDLNYASLVCSRAAPSQTRLTDFHVFPTDSLTRAH